MRWIEAFLFLTGLLLAGSDGAWFPWANLVGVALFIGFTALVKRECREGTYEDLQTDHSSQNDLQSP